MSAQQLIDLVVANITNNVVNLSQRGWMLFLGLSNSTENTIAPISDASDIISNSSDIISDASDLPIAIVIGTTVGAVGVVVTLILCIAAIAYGIHKRYVHE